LLLVLHTEEQVQWQGEVADAIDSSNMTAKNNINQTITVETDLFEHRQVKAHFINPCCFGEDFAAWLKEQLSSLKSSGFSFSEAIQEDYGWGFWARHGNDPFWIALSYVGDGPQEAPAQWVVSVNYDPGLNLIKRFFHRPDRQALEQLRDRVRQAVTSNAAIRIVPAPRYSP
jgi:hypothetical protein